MFGSAKKDAGIPQTVAIM